MMVAHGLTALHRRAVERCQALLEDYGWQGFIEDSGHPAHDVRVVLEEVLAAGGPIAALAELMLSGPGTADDTARSRTLAAAAHAGIATATERAAGLGAATAGALVETLGELDAAVQVAADTYARMRPLALEGHSLADALFGPR